MAVETGTATDYKDLLQKIKAFLTGTNSPTSGLTWQVMREKSSFVSPVDEIPAGDLVGPTAFRTTTTAPSHEIIFKGNGGVSPEIPFYVGIRTFERATDSRFSFEIRGFTGYLEQSPELDFRSQPGLSPPCYTPLQNASMTYWFVGNERRFIAVVKTGTSYQSIHFGLLNTFTNRNVYPYPLYIGGSATRSTFAFNANDIEQSALPHPAGNNSFTLPLTGEVWPASYATAFVRFVDGSWWAVKHYYGLSGNEQPFGASSYPAFCWPMCPSASGTGQNLENRPVSSYELGFGTTMKSNSPGGTPTANLAQTMGSPLFTPMWPTFIFNPASSNGHIYGEIDGLFWLSSAGGLTAEDDIYDNGESPEARYIIFQNVHRSDTWSHFAIRWD